MSDHSLFSSPFAHNGRHVHNVMLNVCIALIPVTLASFYLYGWPAFNLFIVTCFAALICEAVCLKQLKQPMHRVFDGSALLTGWLIAITLPPYAPWWIGVFGSAFAIVLGKQLYGGLGQNIFNPAMLARTALLITFPIQMTSWVQPAGLAGAASPSFMEALAITFFSAPIPDALSGATYLGQAKTALTTEAGAVSVFEQFDWLHAFVGWQAGSMGESSVLLLLLGAFFLMHRGIISWEVPFSMIGVVAMLALFANASDSTIYADPLFHVVNGGLILGAFFIATDPITSPVTRIGKLIFGAGCGLLVFIIRTWGGYPEAVAFAVLFMNGFTPLIDRYCHPRRYGRNNKGEPLPLPTQIELAREVDNPK